MVPAAGTRRAAVLREPSPQGALASCLESACADTNDTEAGIRAEPRLAWFEEEVEPALGPAHAAGAFGEDTGSADSSLLPVYQLVESKRVGEPVSHGGGR